MSISKCFFNIPVFTRYGTTIILLSLCGVFSSPYAVAESNDTRGGRGESKRIEVYSLSQNYWDVQSGDTLGDITRFLLPNNPLKRNALRQDILHLNPDAFINGDPERLLAGKRLWLPGYMKQADSKADPAKVTVETYSWGNIKRPKQ